MKDEQQTYLMICRMIVLLYVPLSVACAISFFFTADLRSSALALFTIVFIMLPEITEKLLHWKKSFPLNLLYFGMILICYTGNLVFRLGRWIPCYDPFCHVITGIFFVIVGLLIPCTRYPVARKRSHAKLVCSFGFLFSVFVGLLFALGELVFYLLPSTASPNALYIFIDLCTVLLSAGVFTFLLYHFPHHRIMKLPVQAITIFVKRNGKPSSITITSVQEEPISNQTNRR
ncbi:MAG: hypothetical protein ACI4PM_01035 [Butyricicoccus sp.]